MVQRIQCITIQPNYVSQISNWADKYDSGHIEKYVLRIKMVGVDDGFDYVEPWRNEHLIRMSHEAIAISFR